MNLYRDSQLIDSCKVAQRGVFSRADLQTLFAEPHPNGFARRTRALEASGVLQRFVRGWYVAPEFDLSTLSQRIAPRSYVSFGTVLARRLLIGTSPQREVTAVKVGRTRTYERHGYRIVHVGIDPTLFFGFSAEDGVHYADNEKAVLDVLYFHLRGRKYVFDIYDGIRHDALEPDRLVQYLKRYRNPRFVSFARSMLGLDRR